MPNAPQPQPFLKKVPRFRNGTWEIFEDTITMEEPLTVSWESSEQNAACGSTTLWAWPCGLTDLALGHVLLDKVPSGSCLYRNTTLTKIDDSRFHVVVGEVNNALQPEPPQQLHAEQLFFAMHEFIKADGLWDSTGCFHRAGVFSVQDAALLQRTEDIGRHNCIDRLAGWSVRTKTPLADKVLLISARMTSSLCAKAIRAGFRIFISRSAVTSAAIDMVTKVAGTLVGFARTDERRFTVFADPAQRIFTK